MAEFDDLSLISYADVAARYLDQYADAVGKEKRWFGSSCRSLEEAIGRASLSQVPNKRGRLVRHGHQQRIPQVVLAEVRRDLLLNIELIRQTKTFRELFDIVRAIVEPIHGSGALLTYDVAQRIGCFLKFEPQEIYLHQGTKLGAKALGLPVDRPRIDIAELPVGLRSLSGSQLEDVLCIYRATLHRLR